MMMTMTTTTTTTTTTKGDDEDNDNKNENENLITIFTTIIMTTMMIAMTEANDGDVGSDRLDPQNDSSVDEKDC